MLRLLKKYKFLVLIASACIISLVPYVLYDLGQHNDQFKRQKTLSQLQEDAHKISFSGQLLYDQVSDTGCSTSVNENVLKPGRKIIDCYDVEEKFYKNNTDLTNDLLKADRNLASDGWQLDPYPYAFVTNLSLADNIATSIRDGGPLSVSYDSGTSFARLVAFSNSIKVGIDPDAVAVKLQKEVPLTDNEYIYGVRIYREYKSSWSF